MEKKLIDLTVVENDGEYVIRLKGEKAAALTEGFKHGIFCCCRPGHGDKTSAGCCE